MGVRVAFGLLVPIALLAIGGLSRGRSNDLGDSAESWNPRGASAYLDSRTKAWTAGGAMDHGTFCISCHTALPYAQARPAMRAALSETEASPVERQLLASVAKRVNLWSEVQPYLGDKSGGLPTEAVLNALVLAEDAARLGRLDDTTKQALRIMWSSQIKTGDGAGAWKWVSFGNEPWEAPDSGYWGATLAALATGSAPDGYLATPQIQGDLKRLTTYLRRGEPDQSLLNRLALLSASTKVPDLVAAPRRAAIVADVLAKQQPDGGWNTASLVPGSWKRHDGTPEPTVSDGYATGFVAYVLEQVGMRHARPELQRALVWLSQNQDRSTGAWLTASPNVTRNPSSDSGNFMTDAATAYAVLALLGAR